MTEAKPAGIRTRLMGLRLSQGIILAVVFLLLGLAIPLFFRNPDLVLKSEDSFEYIMGGQSIARGAGYLAMNGRKQVLFPPGFPLLIAAGSTFFNPVKVAGVVSWLASGFSVLLLFVIARRWFGKAVAALAAGLFAFFPLRVWLAQEALSESLYALLLLLAVWLAMRISTSRMLPVIALGVVAGYAYITRPEGLILIGLLTGVVFAEFLCKRRDARRILAYAVGVVAIVLPYVLWLSLSLGHFALSGKGSGELAHGIARVQGKQDVEMRVLKPNETGVVTGDTSPGAKELAKHFARNLSQLKNAVLVNIGVQPIAGGLLLLGLIQICKKVFQEKLWLLGLLQLFFVLHLLIYTPFWIEHRFLYPSAPFMCAWIAVGAVALFSWIKEGWERSNRAAAFALATVSLLIIANVGSFAWKLKSTSITDDKTHASQEVATIVKNMATEGDGVIGDYPGVAFFAGVHHEWMPTCDLYDLRRFASSNRAGLVAFSERDAATPATRKLLNGNFGPDEAQLLAQVRHGNQDLRVFKLSPIVDAR